MGVRMETHGLENVNKYTYCHSFLNSSNQTVVQSYASSCFISDLTYQNKKPLKLNQSISIFLQSH